jgi:hypothetical protein
MKMERTVPKQPVQAQSWELLFLFWIDSQLTHPR